MSIGTYENKPVMFAFEAAEADKISKYTIAEMPHSVRAQTVIGEGFTPSGSYAGGLIVRIWPCVSKGAGGVWYRTQWTVSLIVNDGKFIWSITT